MNLRGVTLAVVVLVIGGAGFALWPKQKRSPEDEVRALVAQVVDAAAKRDVSGVTEPFPDSFHAANGMGGQELRRYLAALLLRSPKGVAVLNPSLSVTIESPELASLHGTFLFAQEGTDLGSYDISARLAKTDGQWKFTSAEWTR